MFYYLAVAVYVLVCFFLLLSILLQQGRAGDIASAFGGSSSQTVFGARTGATMLTRATTDSGRALHDRVDRAGHRVAEGSEFGCERSQDTRRANRAGDTACNAACRAGQEVESRRLTLVAEVAELADAPA